MSIRETLKNIPVDKAFHFIGGWALVATLYPHFPVLSFVAVIAVAAWKEWDDSQGHGTPDFWDFLVTVAGGVCGAVAHSFLNIF